MCEVLKELYQNVFEETFVFDIDHRVRLQKMVYILENLGVHVGDYSFSWNERGPYSIALDDDVFRCSQSPAVENIKFSEWAKERIEIVKTILSEQVGYAVTEWLECVASLHYLKYVLRCSNRDNDVIRELKNRKSQMKNANANNHAMEWANKIETILWETT